MVKGKLFSWDGEQLKKIPKSSGVYGLYDERKNLIYYGKSNNLKQRLQGYLYSGFSEDTCKMDTAYFNVERTSNPGRREKELMKKHCIENDGRLPRCNDVL